MRSRPPWSQVAHKLTSPSPFPPHSKFPTPRGFPEWFVRLTKTTSRSRLPWSGTMVWLERPRLALLDPVKRYICSVWPSYVIFIYLRKEKGWGLELAKNGMVAEALSCPLRPSQEIYLFRIAQLCYLFTLEKGKDRGLELAKKGMVGEALSCPPRPWSRRLGWGLADEYGMSTGMRVAVKIGHAKQKTEIRGLPFIDNDTYKLHKKNMGTANSFLTCICICATQGMEIRGPTLVDNSTYSYKTTWEQSI